MTQVLLASYLTNPLPIVYFWPLGLDPQVMQINVFTVFNEAVIFISQPLGFLLDVLWCQHVCHKPLKQGDLREL